MSTSQPDHIAQGDDDAQFARPSPDAAYVQFEQLERSQNDTRAYRLLRLNNQLEVLLVHDPDTDKASAALDVHVGSMADPKELQGLAHFCEHMLFLAPGTDKYPQENAYNQYLSEHGGRSNAYTSQEHTNYYFEVDHAAFEGALDRFARFFIAPRFDASCTEREMRAVDSEHKKNIQSDVWRFYQLEKSLSQPDHPYAKFSTGSLVTLMEEPQKAGIDVRDALLDFHSRHYSANQMKLVILGREPLDQLTRWAVDKFLEIPNKQLADSPALPHPYDASRQMVRSNQLFTIPIKDSRKLEITWPFPDQLSYYRVQPSNYLSHLIGHESAGSILSVLKQRGLANYLSAGSSGGARGFDFFKVSIDLTEDGLERYEEVVATVFRYVELLRRSGPQQWIFDEVRNLNDMGFRFKEKSPPSSYTSKLASVMQRPYPRAWVLSGPYLIREYDPALIEHCLSYLRHDNVNLALRSKKLSIDDMQKERWYGTEYHVKPLSKQLVDTLGAITSGKDTTDDGLHLPEPNAFIPTDFTTDKREVKQPAKRPQLVLDTPLLRLWYKKDDTFWVPKVYSWFLLKSTNSELKLLIASACPRGVLGRLYAELLRDSLNEYTYDAEVAGLVYGFDVQQEGILLSVEGYSHKLPLLTEKIVQRVRTLEIDPARFALIKEQLLRAYKNFDMEAPHQHAIYYASYLIQERMWLNEEKLEQLQTISAADLQQFYPQFLQQMQIEAVVHGNITEQDAVQLVQTMEKTLHPAPMYATQHLYSRCILLPRQGAKYVYQRAVPNPDNVNSAIEYYCQVGDVSDTRARALLSLLAQVTNEPCFDQLRTKEQLGYLVFSGVRKQPGVMGLRIIIQSERDPIYLENRIEAFLIKLDTIISSMSEQEFKRHVEALCSTMLEKFKNMYEEGRRYWSHVFSGYYEFDQGRY
ncbi:Metalloenzyme, LuxS/M16 peptidase-like protein [Thamnocephalis sphaerospora]|uniref:Metalloenzyme, LuxS/M16 peptidase-like protein n=1 Tax=Thamnocephalis sphaerospora TaxID=78915 RepID=A0A4P9XM06_9FUNG|nr:Metalloenzyme, LuxS/M16 peptidase-like protein [Thamnocephalis sphaerospora]|eukprot:RKP06928.1 Metalloenzyme, LuxS/M16 peptidase-like protein [Thamnocephalis sphaerospora]